jgi:Phloem protein 2
MVYGHPLADADITWMNGMYWCLKDSAASDFYLKKVAHLNIVCWLDVVKSNMVIPAAGEYAACVRMMLDRTARFSQDIVFDIEEVTLDEFEQEKREVLSSFSWNTAEGAHPVDTFFYENLGTISVTRPNTKLRLHAYAHNDLGKSGWTLDGIRFVSTKWGAAPV